MRRRRAINEKVDGPAHRASTVPIPTFKIDLNRRVFFEGRPEQILGGTNVR